MAGKNADFENFTANHDLEFAKCLYWEVELSFVLILVFGDLEFQVAKLNWVFGQYHGGSEIFMAFEVFREKVLACSRVFEEFEQFQKFLSDASLADFLQTDKIYTFKYSQSNLINNLPGPFLF